IMQVVGSAFAGLLQLLVDAEFDALDGTGWVRRQNLDVKDDALYDLLVMSGEENLRLRDRWRRDGRLQGRWRHQIASGEAGEGDSELQEDSRVNS
ncbi:MAG: hypothetical protein OXG68_03535, partial [Chloroflexi bacterium]|nr:hypothetical protein [Chloroflexota bacterium]